MQKSKWEIRPPPCKIVTPENIILSLCTRDYMSARLPAMQILVSIGTVGVSPNMGEILPFCDFFLTILSCPYLFFSFLRPGRTVNNRRYY